MTRRKLSSSGRPCSQALRFNRTKIASSKSRMVICAMLHAYFSSLVGTPRLRESYGRNRDSGHQLILTVQPFGLDRAVGGAKLARSRYGAVTILGQSKRVQPGADDHDILFAVAPHERHRIGVTFGIERGLPH